MITRAPKDTDFPELDQIDTLLVMYAVAARTDDTKAMGAILRRILARDLKLKQKAKENVK